MVKKRIYKVDFGFPRSVARVHYFVAAVFLAPSLASEETFRTAVQQTIANAPSITRTTILISFQTIARGDRSGIIEFSQVVVRNQADWTALWKKHASVQSNPAPLPAVDFTKEAVVAVFLGKRPTGGHEVEIVSVEQTADSLSVSYVERQPPPGSIVTQAFTQPFHIVRLSSQGSATVTFRRLP
jgi:hypothetical protein